MFLSCSQPDVTDTNININLLQNPIHRVMVMHSIPTKVLVDLGSSVEQPAMWIPLTARWEGWSGLYNTKVVAKRL